MPKKGLILTIGPRQANLVLITYASSEGSGEPAHPRSLARTTCASYNKTIYISRKRYLKNTGNNWLLFRRKKISWLSHCEKQSPSFLWAVKIKKLGSRNKPSPHPQKIK